VVGLFGTHPITRALRMRGQSGTLRSYGIREIAMGLGILAGRNPTPWIWGRVAGDALDLAPYNRTGSEPTRTFPQYDL